MQIPIDVIALIVLQCPTEDLVNLALVDRVYKFEAERLLYREIKLRPLASEAQRALKCLDSLKSYPEKAELVRLFSFDLYFLHRGNLTLCSRLCETLPALTNLKHLSLQVRPSQYDSELILASLRQCTFTLSTFRFTHGLGLANWVPEQTSLKSVAIDGLQLERISEDDLSLFRGLLRLPSHGTSLSLYCHWDTMVVFPGLAPIIEGVAEWSASPIEEHFANLNSPSDIHEFNIYLTSLSDEETLRRVLKSTAANFPAIRTLRLRIQESDIHTYPKSLSSLLAGFKELESLSIAFWDLRAKTAGRYQELRTRLTTDWAEESSTLRSIRFPDGVFMVSREAGEWLQWKPSYS